MAQPAPAAVRRPYRGLFGGPNLLDDTPVADSRRVDLWRLRRQRGGGHTGPTRAATSGFQQSGSFAGAGVTLAYGLAKIGERSTFNLGSGVQVASYYFDSDTSVVPNGHVTVGFGTSLSRVIT